jgi:hypothetical protein
VAAFVLVYVYTARNLSAQHNMDPGKTERHPAVRSAIKLGTGEADMPTLKGKMATINDGGSPRSARPRLARPRSFLRSPRKSVAVMTGLSGFFSGKKKGRSLPTGSTPWRHNSSPPSPLESAAAARGSRSLASTPPPTLTAPPSVRPGSAMDRHGLHEFAGLWDTVEVQELEKFLVARGVSLARSAT